MKREGIPVRVNTGTKWMMAPNISGMAPAAKARWKVGAGGTAANAAITAARKASRAQMPR